MSRILPRAAFTAAILIAFNTAIAAAGGPLQFSQTRIELGTVGAEKKIPFVFRFKNASKIPVKIVSVDTTCGCSAALAAKGKIAPGGEGEIRGVYDPSGKAGKHEANVLVEDSTGARYSLTVAAEIRAMQGAATVNIPGPRIAVAPHEVNLGKIAPGKAAVFTVQVENAGEGDLYITNYGDRNETGVALNKKAIKPGKKVAITFFYVPAGPGPIADEQVIMSNDPVTPVVHIKLHGEALK